MTNELLTVDQMYEADRCTISSGISGEKLMENAGRACADAVMGEWGPCDVAVLCGPGNNGGDGYVIARHLLQADWDVSVFELGGMPEPSGDAGVMKRLWTGRTQSLSDFNPDSHDLIVDAVFGAGLKRPIEGELKRVITDLNNAPVPVFAVDLPSGINGDKGCVEGSAISADRWL